jgi:SAM-dependent methyltransferase
MIPFFQIDSDCFANQTTPEKRLAREMGKPPWPVQKADGLVAAGIWAQSLDSAYVGMIFDPEFWYDSVCWNHWIDRVQAQPPDAGVDVPLGNQNPSWRNGLSVPLYATLRQLENAAAFEAPDLWRSAIADHSNDFAVCVAPVGMLRSLPETLLLKDLPEYWVNTRRHLRIFCKGWLHAFNAIPDSGRREDLAAMCDWQGNVLELGCDQGLMAANIRDKGLDVSWVGLDINRSALETARAHVRMAVQADLTRTLPFGTGEKFDRIVCGDVLEHLAYPCDLLAQLRALISPEGILVASFPNIGHWSVIEDLLAGRWDETPSGIFCLTHLRFGTRNTWNRWFKQAGWQIHTWESETLPTPPNWTEMLKVPPVEFDLQSLETLRYRVAAVPDNRSLAKKQVASLK